MEDEGLENVRISESTQIQLAKSTLLQESESTNDNNPTPGKLLTAQEAIEDEDQMIRQILENVIPLSPSKTLDNNLEPPFPDQTLTIGGVSDFQVQGDKREQRTKKSVLFGSVTEYRFSRSQGFTSVPSQGGSTLGMKRRHFLKRQISVNLFEEVRRRSRRQILLKIKSDEVRAKRVVRSQIHCNSVSSSTSSSSNTTTSDSDSESFEDFSDISDSELEGNCNYIFLQPFNVKSRRSLLRASGIIRIDPKEKKECKIIRESRNRSGCNCVNQCIPDLCECSRLGVNCHVDRVSFPCGCVASGCQNPQGRTEFDMKRVKEHLFDTLFMVGVG